MTIRDIIQRDIDAIRYVTSLLIAHIVVANSSSLHSSGEYKRPCCSRPSYITLAFSTPMEGFPWDDLHKILHGSQGWLRYKW